MKRSLAVAALFGAISVASVARAQDQEPPREPAPYEYKPKPPAPEPAAEPAPAPAPKKAETILDETKPEGGDDSKVGRGPAKAPASSSEICVSCILIGVGAVILIGAIPLAAKLDGAGRRKDRLGLWLEHQGGASADVGFIAGYGFAKAKQDQLVYGVSTGVVAGIGAIILGTGVTMVALSGGFLRGPKSKSDKRAFVVAPSAGPEGGGVDVVATF